MVVAQGQHTTMYSCRVLYIGSAPPVETLRGTESLQKPLRERYPNNLEDVEGIDATLAVMPDCLEMTYTASGQVIQFPLARLNICAAMRAVTAIDGTTGEKTRQFVPVNTIQSDSKQPAIFAAIIRRKQGRQIAECHAFICNATRDALHLVNTTATANMALKQQMGRQIHNGYENDVPVVHSAQNGYTTATANMALNQQMGRQIHNGYENDVPVVHSARNDYVSTNGGDHIETIVIGGGEATEYSQTQAYPRSANEPIYVKSTVDTVNSFNYPAVRQQESQEENTIYITFDKSNLVSKDTTSASKDATSATLQVKTSYNEEYQQTSPRYVDVPSPRPVALTAPRYVMPPPPPPPSQILYARPPMRQMRYTQAAPQPNMLMVRPPIIVRPPPSRLYTRRVMSPPARYVAPAPAYYSRRARSSSPVYSRGALSDTKHIRISKNDKYQRKWKGPSSDIIDYRLSRRDIYDNPGPTGPPRDFRRSENQFLNERAFSRRMNADNRISRASTPYHYPTAYELHDAMLYTKPTTKSNPKYSSSSSASGSDNKDNRFSKSLR